MATATDPEPARVTPPGRATAVGGVALLLWGTLAWLTTVTARVPAFELMALVFATAFALAVASWWVRGERARDHLRLPPAVWALGLFGIFGYHALFFVALRTAPAAEANLINYLWPVLLALLSTLAAGQRLRVHHAVGLALGFAGAALVASGGHGFRFAADALWGYLAALGCAVIWPLYSVWSRRVVTPTSGAVGAFCGASALVAAALHLGLEPWVAPTGGEWAAIVAMGLGPMGLALFAWDVGMKRGDVRLLAVASYGEPLLSTLVLAAAGRAELHASLGLACALVVAGAVAGGWDVVRGPARARRAA